MMLGSGGVLAIDWLNGCRTPLMDGRLSGAFLGFSLGTPGLGGLLISRGARTVRLDRTASGLLAKLARLLTTTFVAAAARGASDDGDER